MTNGSESHTSQNSFNSTSAGARFRQAVVEERPLQVMGAINAYCAMMATQAGYRAIYLSGAGVANACFGLPDLGMTSATEVAEEIRRITSVTQVPLLVDADTGWGHAFTIARTVQQFTRAGAAGLHLEDQLGAKRCGHRPNKALASTEEMVDRIKAAVDARTDQHFVIMARTDAIAELGVEQAIERAQHYAANGADMIFAEALQSIEDAARFAREVPVPVLANITEFGKTPLWSVDELRNAGIRLALYPLSAFRAMNQAAAQVYSTIRQQGSSKSLVAQMQTRDQLYHHLGYHAFEQKLDQLFAKENQ
ncbi:MAG: methylisocitrate lyase [Planctomycetaceae bacterium]|nr:methylisocitrate lyase [Planctomycetaceae bacterium]